MSTFFILSLFAGAAYGADIKASHCEIFIDKISKELWSEGYARNLGTNVYLKVMPSRLDGVVRAVGFHHESTESNAYGGRLVHSFQTEYLNRISDDYFQIFLPLRTEDLKVPKYSRGHTHRGAFFVETSRGTRYWANADRRHGTGLNFFFHAELMDALWNIQNNLPLGSIPATGTYEGPGNYLNPQRCR